jgi:hypothetical protein
MSHYHDSPIIILSTPTATYPSLVAHETYIPRTVETIFPIFSACQSEHGKQSDEPRRSSDLQFFPPVDYYWML